LPIAFTASQGLQVAPSRSKLSVFFPDVEAGALQEQQFFGSSFSQEVAVRMIIKANTIRFIPTSPLKGEYPALWRDTRYEGQVPFRGFRGDIASSRENVFMRLKIYVIKK